MTMIPVAAVKHYKQMQRLQAIAVLAAADMWSEVSLSDLSGSWAAQVPLLVPLLTGVQVKAAAAGASYGAETLADQGLYEAPQRFVDPAGFGGFASDGRSLAGLLYSPVPHTKTLIAGGMDPGQALKQGGKFLTTVTRTQVADAGRAAAGVDTAVRRSVGYVRMLNPPSCSRCSILAGRFYRWNAGFNRHPRCDCVHVQTTAVAAAESEGLVHDPYEYFKSLSEAEQDRTYGKADAQAVRDGADIFQVVNARRGVKPGGLVTTEGTSRRGNFGRGNGPRLTPEAIYQKGLSREQTLSQLERYGYILPGGQNPSGSITGQREGFGALGRGGTRVGARTAVERAIATGVRDPKIRATMTAAERRVFDAQANWDAVRAGRNPFSNAKKAKVTPEIAARVEREYRKHILGY
ncbi:head maturation protease [Arthrobacter phage Seahorse]|uniref:Capsid maturation protease n=1 Tax=Arthrobacter phage Seahorse TaxID=2419611 RepID=A0A3G3M5Y2_9CAUD|nr:head maturation protease [Arthrobacter phage Seahorse]AYR01507.1 capsid maturation protease [Arthrobacter phage Seahorse]